MFKMFGLLAFFFVTYSIDGIFKSTDGCLSICFKQDAVLLMQTKVEEMAWLMCLSPH